MAVLDIVSGVVGPNGNMVGVIEQFLPGGTRTIVFFCTIVFLFFVIRGRSFTEGPKEMWSYLLILTFLIFVLTGNIFHVFLAIIVLIGIQYIEFRSLAQAEFGSHDERAAIKGAGYPYEAQKKAALQEEAMEDEDEGDDPLGKVATKVEEALAEESERQIEIELHEEAISACAETIAQTVSDLQDKELSFQQRNKKIIGFITVLDQQLVGMDNKLAINDVGQQYIEAFSDKLAELLGELVKDSKFEEGYRKELTSHLEKSVRTIKVAVNEAIKIEKRALRVERQLEKLSAHEIKEVVKAIKEKKKDEAKLRREFKSMSSSKENRAAKIAVGQQLREVVNEIAALEVEKAKLDDMEDELHTVLKKLKATLRKLKRDLHDLKKLVDEVFKQEKAMKKFNGEFNSAIKEMKIAHADFVKEMKNLETESPEEVAIKTTKDVGVIYTRLIEVAKLTMDFNKYEMQPFIALMIKTISGAEEVAKSSYYLNFFQIRIEQAFQDLNKLAASVAKGEKVKRKLFKDLDEEKTQENLARYIAKVGQSTMVTLQAVVKNLMSAQIKIKEHEQFTVAEIAGVQVEEKLTFDALTRVTKNIMLHKKRVHKEFMVDASEYSKRLKQARADTMAARSAA